MSRENVEEVLSLEEDEEVGAEDESDEISDVFSCKYCDFQSSDIDELDEHIISHDEAIIEDDHQEDTDIIGSNDGVNNDSSKFSVGPFSSSGSKSPLNYEIDPLEQPSKRMKQSVPAFYEEFKNKVEKRVFVCPYCGYQSMKKLDMHKHLKVHNEPVELPVYSCAECPYTTRRKCDMPKHLLTHCKDGSVTMYKCDHCPYATKRKGDLTKHMICHKKADAESLFRCHQCIYYTRRRGDLKKHLLSHEGDFGGVRDNLLFNCTECGYTSKRLNDLNKHVVLHCDKGVKGILKCTKCDYATEVGSHFAKHVLSNCRVVDMGVAIFSKDSETMQDYIVLEEDELHLYQLDKESFTSVAALEKDTQSTRKRKRAKDDDFVDSEHSDLDNYYVDNEEGLEDSELLEDVEDDNGGDKVLILAGYGSNEKAIVKKKT